MPVARILAINNPTATILSRTAPVAAVLAINNPTASR